MKKILFALSLCLSVAFLNGIHEVTNPSELLKIIESEINETRYCQEILPHDPHYFVKLIDVGYRTQQSREYIQAVIRMYRTLIDRMPCANAYVYADLFQQFPTLIKHYFIPYKEVFDQSNAVTQLELLDRFQLTMTSMVLNKFKTDFDQFKKEPELFLHELSFKIVTAAQDELSIDQLRQSTIRLIETCLHKLMWSPVSHEHIWTNFKNLSEQLKNLMEHNIIYELNDLDDLYWMLLHRFCYFMEISSTDLPLEFYEKIKGDLHTSSIALFEINEQEPFMINKIDYFLRILLMCEAKKRAEAVNIHTAPAA